MRISHHKRSREATVDVFTVRNDGAPTTYMLKTFLGRGNGSPAEPCIYVDFSEEELYTFAIDILNMITKESRT